MSVTRDTERFDQLAKEVELECRGQGVTVDPRLVDSELNRRIAVVADLMRIGQRAAFSYCPNDIAPDVATSLVEAVRTPATG